MASIEEQLVETSRKVTDIVTANIGDSQELFDETMELVYRDEPPISMRASWVVFFVCEKYPWLARPHIVKLLKFIPNASVDGTKRTALKLLADAMFELSEEHFGELADICFTFAEDPKEAIAIRAFSLDVLLNVRKKYPEITPELIAIMESIMPDGSRGLKNKCLKAIRKLRQENNQ